MAAPHPQPHVSSFAEPAPPRPAGRRHALRHAFRHYTGLALVLAEREFVAGFRGNWTGALTTFAVPLLMLLTYSFVFSTLIPVRIRPEQTRLDYAFFLFSGLVIWNGIVDVGTRAPRIFAESRHYTQRPQFPTSLLLVAPALAALYRALPWLVAYAVGHWVLLRPLPATAWLAPVALLWMLAMSIGISLALAALGAFIRDLGDLAPPLFTLLFFLSPILYPIESIEQVSPWVAAANPIAAGIELGRDLLFEGRMPTADLALRCGAAAAGALAIGILAHRWVRSRLADLT